MDGSRLVATGVALLCATAAIYLAGQRGTAVDVQRANDLGSQGRFAAALEAVQDVTGRPAAIEARTVRGRALLALRRYRAAEREFAAALREAPDSWQLHRDRAVALAGVGRRAEVGRELSAALALNPRMALPPGFTLSGLAREPR